MLNEEKDCLVSSQAYRLDMDWRNLDKVLINTVDHDSIKDEWYNSLAYQNVAIRFVCHVSFILLQDDFTDRNQIWRVCLVCYCKEQVEMWTESSFL